MAFLCRPLQCLQPQYHPPVGLDAAGPVPGILEESRECHSVCESLTPEKAKCVYFKRSSITADEETVEMLLKLQTNQVVESALHMIVYVSAVSYVWPQMKLP